jgi:hypothetical protein
MGPIPFHELKSIRKTDGRAIAAAVSPKMITNWLNFSAVAAVWQD